MRYNELPIHWQRIFELEWKSVCEGSKAIAAVIVDENGEIVSEGRNQISECNVPNPATAHAEVEAIRNLDVSKYPNPKKYTLYAGLEPCIMCMGTLVMGHIRKVVIAARDDFGGAMNLIECSKFAKSKGIQTTFLDNEIGDMQRAFQTIRELIYSPDNDKRKFMLHDFSVYNKVGVIAAKELVESGFFEDRTLAEIAAEEVFDQLSSRFLLAGRGITSEKRQEEAYNECGVEAGRNVGDFVNKSSLRIDTERCVIRRFVTEDANDLYQVLSNAEVMQYIEPPFDLEQTKEFIQVAGFCEPPRVYALEWKETGKVIGHVIFHLYEKDSYEIGWILNRNDWGKGIADEITKSLVEYAKGTEAASCVIECDTEQEASKRIALKNGFVYEGEEDGCDVYRRML